MTEDRTEHKKAIYWICVLALFTRLRQCCIAPAQFCGEPLRQRPEHRAGEAAEQRQRGNGLAVIAAKGAHQHGEGRVIQRCRHGQSDAGPHHIEFGNAGDP